MTRLSNIYLHPSVSSPDVLSELCMATGLVPTQSSRERNKIILITPEDAILRAAISEIMDGVDIHQEQAK